MLHDHRQDENEKNANAGARPRKTRFCFVTSYVDRRKKEQEKCERATGETCKTALHKVDAALCRKNI